MLKETEILTLDVEMYLTQFDKSGNPGLTGHMKDNVYVLIQCTNNPEIKYTYRFMIVEEDYQSPVTMNVEMVSERLVYEGVDYTKIERGFYLAAIWEYSFKKK